MKKRIEEAAVESRRASAETLTTFGLQSSIDDVVKLTGMELSYDEVAESAFEKGAEWRIDSAWHYDLDKAETGRQFLVEFKNGRVGMFDDIWVIKGMGDLVARYAYVSDLLPERKEVTR